MSGRKTDIEWIQKLAYQAGLNVTGFGEKENAEICKLRLLIARANCRMPA